MSAVRQQSMAVSRPRYTAAEHRIFADEAIRDGFAILRGHFPVEVLEHWKTAFQPLLDDHVAKEGHRPNRGPNRFYVTLPFIAPFADPVFFEDEDILAIVELLIGKDPVMCQLATDTPMQGSDYQDLHRDAPPLFAEWGRETPAFQLAVNFPLVDVTLPIGPPEIARGTHMMSHEEAAAAVEAGRTPLEPVLMTRGDVMIRDVRAIHRGTPNRTDTPRPMVVIGYSRKWLFRPEVHIRVPRAVHETLSERARRLLRFNPIVDQLEPNAGESYRAFGY